MTIAVKVVVSAGVAVTVTRMGLQGAPGPDTAEQILIAQGHAVAAQSAETGAVAARTAAETAKTGAETAASSTQTAETGAVAARTAAETAKTGAEAAAETATTKATQASSSAATAGAKATEATEAAVGAQGSATAAAGSAGTASTKAAEATSAAETASAASLSAGNSAATAAVASSEAVTAKNDAQTAKTAAETARTGSETARDVAVAAENDAQAARTAAEAAQTGAVSAKTAAEAAEAGAVSAKNSAETARSGAETAQTAAAASESTATTKAAEASTSAAAAGGSATAASGSATAAAASAAAASGFATTASTKATEAATSATAASGSEAAAAGSATAASISASAAAGSATAASTKATEATTSADNAATAAASAAGSATAAVSAAGSAAASATSAANDRTMSANSAVAAQNASTSANTSAGIASAAADRAVEVGGSLSYLFSTSTVDADPGTANLRLNHVLMESATTMYVDLTDRLGHDVASILDSIDESTNPGTKAIVQLFEPVTGKMARYRCFFVTTVSGYRKLDLVYIGGSTGSFVGGSTIALNWSQVGDQHEATGPDESVQFNDGGAFGGDTRFRFDKIAGKLIIPALVAAGLLTTTSVGLEIDNANSYVKFLNDEVRRGYIQVRSDAFEVWSDQNVPMVFGVNNAEAARLTSAGLSIPGYVNVGGTSAELLFSWDDGGGKIQTYGGKALSLNPLGNIVVVGDGGMRVDGISAFATDDARNGIPTSLVVGGALNGNQKFIQLGYNQSSDYGEIAAVHNGLVWKDLYLQRLGGGVRVGPSGVVSDGPIGAGGLYTKIGDYSKTKATLRFANDANHGIGYFGAGTGSDGSFFAGVNINGPVVYGYSGGGLGIVIDGQADLSTAKLALRWDAALDLFAGGHFYLPGNISTSAGQITAGVTGVSGFQIINDGTFGTLDNQSLKFRVNSTKYMELSTAGNVLIRGAPDTGWAGTSGISIGGDAPALKFHPTAGAVFLNYAASGNLRWYNSTTDVILMHLAGAGNLGLGIAPFAWDSAFRAIDLQSYLGIYSTPGGGVSGFGENAYYNGGTWKRKWGGNSVLYQLSTNDGTHRWFNAGSAAGDADIGWTQTMLLDLSGLSVPGSLTASTGLFVGETTTSHFAQFTAGPTSTAGLNFDNGSTRQFGIWSRGDIGAVHMFAPNWDILYDVAAGKLHHFRVDNVDKLSIHGSGISVTGHIGFSAPNAFDIGVIGGMPRDIALLGSHYQYNYFNSVSDWERLTHFWAGSTALILTQSAGFGVARGLTVGTSGAAPFQVATNNIERVLVNDTEVRPTADNAMNLGTSAKRWGDGRFTGTVYASRLLLETDSVFTAGAIMHMPVNGMVIAGRAGSIDDLFLGTPGGQLVMRNPTGTQDAVFGGHVSTPKTSKTGVYTVAGLPPAATAGQNARAAVNDSNAMYVAANVGVIVVGGGTFFTPVYSDGTDWRIGG